MAAGHYAVDEVFLRPAVKSNILDALESHLVDSNRTIGKAIGEAGCHKSANSVGKQCGRPQEISLVNHAATILCRPALAARKPQSKRLDRKPRATATNGYGQATSLGSAPHGKLLPLC